MSLPTPKCSVHGLPDETLTEVLGMACDEQDPIRRQNTKTIFASVCKAWKLVSAGWNELTAKIPTQMKALPAKLIQDKQARKPATSDGYQRPHPRSLTLYL